MDFTMDSAVDHSNDLRTSRNTFSRLRVQQCLSRASEGFHRRRLLLQQTLILRQLLGSESAHGEARLRIHTASQSDFEESESQKG